MNLCHIRWRKAILLSAFALVGCTRWRAEEAPVGFAIVREHVIDAPGNDPPVRSTLDYTLTAIDGAAVTRETVPPWIDIQPGALVHLGTHRFKALVSPHARRLGDRPKEESFSAIVESGKVYFLVDRDGQPVLIEARTKPR